MQFGAAGSCGEDTGMNVLIACEDRSRTYQGIADAMAEQWGAQ